MIDDRLQCTDASLLVDAESALERTLDRKREFVKPSGCERPELLVGVRHAGVRVRQDPHATGDTGDVQARPVFAIFDDVSGDVIDPIWLADPERHQRVGNGMYFKRLVCKGCVIRCDRILID